MAVKTVALVAHDHCKNQLVYWAKKHRQRLQSVKIFATGTTSKLLSESTQLPVTAFMSGPLGGDQQIGAKIAEGDIDALVFFWDPLSPMPHDPDIKALLRLATLWNIPIGCNESTADMIILSPLFSDPSWQRRTPDFTAYTGRTLPKGTST